MRFYDFNASVYDDKKKIIVYGHDEFTVMTAYALNELEIELYSYATEEGEILPNVPIMSVYELGAFYEKEECIILLAMGEEKYVETIQLMDRLGIKEVYNIWSLLNKVDFMKSNYSALIKRKYFYRERAYIYQEKTNHPDGVFCMSIDAMVTERCSLKCKDCSNLMQYYECPQNLDVAELIKSINVLLTKVDRIAELRILGGEPFMNRDFVKLIDAFLEENKIWSILIFSNATIFPDEEILSYLHNKKVVMRFSDYGVLSRNLQQWVLWCEENDVRCDVFKMDNWQDCGKLEKRNYSEEGKRAIYNTCDCRNIPTILKGKLYNCPYAANAANLMAMDVEDAEKDGLVLDENVSKEEIHAFLYERPYLEACGYCSGRNTQRAHIEPFVQTKEALLYEKRGLLSRKAPQTDANEREIVWQEASLVSIVIPVYNVVSYVEKCLKSILNQSYTNLEILVIDDGSTDGSRELCEEISKTDDRIKYLKNEHQGVVVTRNTGIEAATGTYIMFVDADDWAEADYVKKMVEGIKDCDVAIADYMQGSEKRSFKIGPNDNYTTKSLPIEKGRYVGDKMKEIWFRMNLGAFEPGHFTAFMWRTIFKTDKFKQIYKLVNPEIFLGEDTVYTTSYLLMCDTARILEATGYYHLIRANEGKNTRYKGQGYLSMTEQLYWNKRAVFEQHKYREVLLEQLGYEMQGRLGNRASKIHGWKTMYYYPYYGRLKNKKIVLYGAGNVGKSFHHSILKDDESKLVLWVDKTLGKCEGVLSVSEIFHVEYDYIIIAVYDRTVYEEIKNELIGQRVLEEKILWSPTKEM